MDGGMAAATGILAFAGGAESPWGWLPPNINSAYGKDIDWLYFAIMTVVLVMFAATELAILWFCIAYRQRPGRKATYLHGSRRVEMAWSIGPGALLLWLALVQADTWWTIKTRMPAEKDAFVVQVFPKQFEWHFRYPDEKGSFGDWTKNVTAMGSVVFPADRPILLKMSSQDVIHSFFIPRMRVKQDVVPGMLTRTWFKANHIPVWNLSTQRAEFLEFDPGAGKDEFKDKKVAWPFTIEVVPENEGWWFDDVQVKASGEKKFFYRPHVFDFREPGLNRIAEDLKMADERKSAFLEAVREETRKFRDALVNGFHRNPSPPSAAVASLAKEWNERASVVRSHLSTDQEREAFDKWVAGQRSRGRTPDTARVWMWAEGKFEKRPIAEATHVIHYVEVMCAELCGIGHTRMRAVARFLPPERHREWLDRMRESLAEEEEIPDLSVRWKEIWDTHRDHFNKVP